jgi:hypothetical protein
MKAFSLWAGIFILLFTGVSLGAHFTRSAVAEKILVAVDVSGSLEDVKHRLPRALAFLEGKRYAQFMIVTNSANRSLRVIQDWAPTLDLAAVERIKMYAPLDLTPLLAFEELSTADLIVFVTNAEDTGALSNVPRSRIVRVR